MKAMVKCPYCNEYFDRNNPSIPFVKTGRRYAHQECWDKHEASLTQEERDKEAFFEYAKQLFGKDYNYILTKKLAERYVKENQYSYSGMMKTLKWYYEIKGNSLEKSNGSIGLIPYIYKSAWEYYYNLFIAQQMNEKKDVLKYLSPKVREYTITSPRASRQMPQLWFEEDDE
jgi:hypothetical protein